MHAATQRAPRAGGLPGKMMYIHHMAKMVRKQVYLTEEQDRALHRAAAREQRSEAEVLRAALDRHLLGKGRAFDAKGDALWHAVGIGRSG